MRALMDISDFIFVDDAPEVCDIIFLPGGSAPEPSEIAARLWHDGYAPLLLPQGAYNASVGRFPGPKAKADIYADEYETEWDFMKSVLTYNSVDESAILEEKTFGVRGTLDNAAFSRALTDRLGLHIRKAIIACKSFHARRCLITYSWAYPETEFIVCPADVDNISKDSWFKDATSTARVMSELEKCGKYFTQAIPLFAEYNRTWLH